MMKPVLIYCYDAYCGWCYGFSPVIRKIATAYKDSLQCEVLSGGMILPEQPTHIGAMAGYIEKSYKRVEQLSGVRFGEDYLWHIRHPQDSDWFPDSRKPAVALCIFRELYPDLQVQFASDLQYSHHFEGRDLTDNEAYRHLLDKYAINADDFYDKLNDVEYDEKANYDFALVKQLKVTGYPTVLIQTGETQFFLVARGYTDYDTVNDNILKVLQSITNSSSSAS